MSAAGGVLETAVLDLCGEICVTGAGAVLEVCVIPGTGIAISDHSGNGGAAGISVDDTTQKFGTVFFPACCCPFVLSGRPAVQKPLQLLQVNLQTGGNTVQGHTNGRTVGLPEHGKL